MSIGQWIDDCDTWQPLYPAYCDVHHFYPWGTCSLVDKSCVVSPIPRHCVYVFIYWNRITCFLLSVWRSYKRGISMLLYELPWLNFKIKKSCGKRWGTSCLLCQYFSVRNVIGPKRLLPETLIGCCLFFNQDSVRRF